MWILPSLFPTESSHRVWNVPRWEPPKTPFSTVLEYQDLVHPADDEKTVGSGGPPAQNWRVKSCSVHCGKDAGPDRLASSSLPRKMAEQDALPNPVLKSTGVTFVAASRLALNPSGKEGNEEA